DEANLEPLPDRSEPLRNAVEQNAAVAQRSVDFEQEMLELERPASGNVDDEGHAPIETARTVRALLLLAREPVDERRLLGARLPGPQLRAQLADGSMALREHVVRVHRLEVGLPRGKEVAAVERRHCSQRSAHRVP